MTLTVRILPISNNWPNNVYPMFNRLLIHRRSVSICVFITKGHVAADDNLGSTSVSAFFCLLNLFVCLVFFLSKLEGGQVKIGLGRKFFDPVCHEDGQISILPEPL